MQIVDLKREDGVYIQQAAQILVDAFKADWPDAWPDVDSALEEIQEMLTEDHICRVALDAEGLVVGWIGGIPEYDGNVWELHPLAVAPKKQGQGIGRALVMDFEQQVAARGGITIMLGSDDETDMTSLSGVDLYTDVWEHITNIQNKRWHPFTFYQKMGFVIVGVIPDANGFGKPDILMAKRVVPQNKKL